jgi:hypothetical protein
MGKQLLNWITCGCETSAPFFSSPGPKVQVNYCHHLASVVCKLFTFQASSPKPLGQFEPNLAGMFLTRLAAASDKAYQLLAHGRWFSPSTPASSTTKTGCHDIAEILLKVQPVLVVEEAGVLGENHRPWASNW